MNLVEKKFVFDIILYLLYIAIAVMLFRVAVTMLDRANELKNKPCSLVEVCKSMGGMSMLEKVGDKKVFNCYFLNADTN